MHHKAPFLNKTIIIFILSIYIFPLTVNPEIVDRVVAYVDDYAITMYELEETKKGYRDQNIEMSTEEIIDSIINKVLLGKEAKKMRLDISDNKNPIKEYIDIKIRSLIFIKEEEIQNFYNQNKVNFGDVPLSLIKDNIEKYLIEQEVNRLLKQHISELRQKSNIVIHPKIGQSD